MVTAESSDGAEFVKLVRCRMRNAEGQPTVRFVALEYFQLWEYMMRQRHGFSFDEYALCLWLSQAEYQQNPDLYAHSGELERVNRVDIAVYDESNHYTYNASRYVLESESGVFSDIVKEHVPEELRQSDRFEMQSESGYVVVREHSADHDGFVLGIYGGLHDVY